MIQTKYLTKEEQREVGEILGGLGLKKTEQDVYVALVQLGPSSLSPIAQGAGLPLTTTQSVVGRLHAKGLIELTQKKSRSLYAAEDPSVLRTLVQEQERSITNLLPLLRKLKNESDGAGKIKIYRGRSVEEIFHTALRAQSKTIYEIVSGSDIQDVLGEKFHFTKRRVEKGIKLKSLRIESNEIKRYSKEIHVRELREARYLPRELTFHSSIMLWDSTVAFFTTPKDGIAWTVENQTTRDTFKQLFNLLWSLSRVMENK